MEGLSAPYDTPNAIPLRAGNMKGRPRLANNSFSHAGSGGRKSVAYTSVQPTLDSTVLLLGFLDACGRAPIGSLWFINNRMEARIEEFKVRTGILPIPAQ